MIAWLRRCWRLFAGTPVPPVRSLTGHIVRGKDGTWEFQRWPPP